MNIVALGGIDLPRLRFLAFALGLLLPSISVAFIPSMVEGQVVISEIMYDVDGSDTDREWIEVFNSGGAPVDLTEWKLFEGNTNHSLVSFSGSETLLSGSYAVIADSPEKFIADRPGFSGNLFDSSFSLSNTGETLVLRCCGSELTDKDTAVYTGEGGAAGDGKSLQLQSAGGTFIAAVPTLGSGTLASATPTPSPSPISASPATSATPAPSDASAGGASVSISAISLDAGADRTAVAGADSTFKARAFNKKKEPLTSLLFRWNFGDGSTAMGSTVTHAFEYPGRYSVVLSVLEDEAASDQLVVTVDEMQLTLSVGSGGVAIENQSKREIDMSAWKVAYQGQRFVMPANTILLAGQTLRLTPRTLGFTVGEGVELVYPNGVVALRSAALAQAPAAVSPDAIAPLVPTPTPQPEPVQEQKQDVEQSEKVVEPSTPEDEPVVEMAAASAQVALAANAIPKGSSSWWLGALGVALFGSGAVYAARRFKKREWNIIEESAE